MDDNEAPLPGPEEASDELADPMVWDMLASRIIPC